VQIFTYKCIHYSSYNFLRNVKFCSGIVNIKFLTWTIKESTMSKDYDKIIKLLTLFEPCFRAKMCNSLLTNSFYMALRSLCNVTSCLCNVNTAFLSFATRERTMKKNLMKK
jgi:hypothetical protein